MERMRALCGAALLWAGVLGGAAVCAAAEGGAGPAGGPGGAGGAEPGEGVRGSIQDWIDGHPGRMIHLPAGDYPVSKSIEIRADGTGLCGPGRIIQSDPGSPIIHVIQARGVQIRDLTLTRAPGKQETTARGILAEGCRELVLENLQVLDNHGNVAIRISGCSHSQIRHCLVRDYTGLGVDDRTRPGEFGVAFRCMDGTGIQVDNSVGTMVSGNRVLETRLIGTPELWQQQGLGKIVKRSGKAGAQPPEPFQRDSVDNWHQGSAIHVANPEVSDFTQVIGNHIENAGQGIDVHADHTIISANIVHNAFIGIKVMHGSRHVSILGNQLSKVDLWGILLQPGSASHAGRDATATEPARSPNLDGGSIVANNIITEFGYGNEYWNWKKGNCFPIFVQGINDPLIPPLQDLLITGNVVYDTGRDLVMEDGKRVRPGPRYQFAICVYDGPHAPRNVVVSNNILHPGTDGVSNLESKP